MGECLRVITWLNLTQAQGKEKGRGEEKMRAIKG